MHTWLTWTQKFNKKLSLILNPHLPHAIIISQGAGCPDADSAPRDERPGNEASPRNEMCVDKKINFLLRWDKSAG